MNYKSLVIGVVAWALYVVLSAHSAEAAENPLGTPAVCSLEPNGAVWVCIVEGGETSAKGVTYADF